VITKIIEAFFRHKLLLLLPPILIPAIVTPLAIMANPPVYETSVGVWVGRPAYLTYKDDNTSAWVTGVQSQSGKLAELLRTRAFIDDVAKRTSLAPLAGSPAGESRLGDLIARSVVIGASTAGPGTAGAAASEHLLVIRVQSGTAQVAYELCKAIVDAYQEKTAADQADEASVAADFYQSQLQDAQQKLTKASQDLRRYVAAQQAAGIDSAIDDGPGSLPAAMLDPRLGALQDNVQTAQFAFKQAQTGLDQAQQGALIAAQGQQYSFQILDAPQMPTSATPQTKKIVVYPIAAAVGGLVLSAVLLVLIVASDRSIRSEADLMAGMRLLGAVPHLRLRRVPKGLRPVATRRAIGAVAGAALPAPGGAK